MSTEARSPGSARLTLMEAVIAAIREEMQRDKRVVVLGQDIGRFGGPMQSTKGLFESFGPKRILEMPISEAAMVGAAIGAAMHGLRPIVEISFGEFLPCAMNQLILQAPNIHYMTGGAAVVPIVVRTRVGDGPYGGHPQDYSAWFGHIPGLKVVMPSTPADAKGLMTAAIRDDDPVLFFEPMSLVHGARGDVPLGLDHVVPIGRAARVRQGGDLTVAAIGSMVPAALEAAEVLAGEGVETDVIDVRSLAPFDLELLLSSVRQTSRLVVAHEAWVSGGFGAEISALVAEHAIDYLAGPIRRVGALHVPIPSGPLRQFVLPRASDILRAARSTLDL